MKLGHSGILLTTPEEVEEFYEDYQNRFTSGLVTLKAWKHQTERRMKALYRHAKKYGFRPYEDAAEALLEVYEHVLWNQAWREEGFKRVKAYVEANPQMKADYKPTNNNMGRKRTNDN